MLSWFALAFFWRDPLFFQESNLIFLRLLLVFGNLAIFLTVWCQLELGAVRDKCWWSALALENLFVVILALLVSLRGNTEISFLVENLKKPKGQVTRGWYCPTAAATAALFPFLLWWLWITLSHDGGNNPFSRSFCLRYCSLVDQTPKLFHRFDHRNFRLPVTDLDDAPHTSVNLASVSIGPGLKKPYFERLWAPG